MPEVDLLDELDADCWCGKPPEECEEQGGCRWARELGRLQDEVTRLRAGEDTTPRDPGTEPTPGQWIHRWNQLTAEERLDWAKTVLANTDTAWRCQILERHQDAKEELEELYRYVNRQGGALHQARKLLQRDGSGQPGLEIRDGEKWIPVVLLDELATALGDFAEEPADRRTHKEADDD